MYQPNSNVFNPMTSYCMSPHHYQFCHQPPMMSSNGFIFTNPSPIPKPSFSFYGQNQRRGFQVPQQPFNFPPIASTSGFLPSSGSKTFSILSNDSGSKEPETPREVFFRTLMTSLKEANKYYSGKSTSWKNPFLYKTTLCENYCSRSYCRYGVNCWYAHGIHELRCIPESDDLPSHDFIAQYLSFLGLPKNVLDDIIAHAFQTAQHHAEIPWFMSSKKSLSDPPSFGSVHSTSPLHSSSPIKDSPPSLTPNPIGSMKSQIPQSFRSSIHSNGGDWDVLRTAIDGVVDETQIRNNFAKSFRLFSDSHPFKRDL